MISNHMMDDLADIVDYAVGHAEGTPAERAEEIRAALTEKGCDTKFEEFLSWFPLADDSEELNPIADVKVVCNLLRAMVKKWPAGQSRNTALSKLTRIENLASKAGAK